MASAWGSSWGVSWGDSFGVISDIPVPLPKPPASGAGGGPISKLTVVRRVRGSARLELASHRAFPVRITGRGKAHERTATPLLPAYAPSFRVGGATRLRLSTVPTTAFNLSNEAIIAKGLHDVSDTEVMAMILALLDL